MVLVSCQLIVIPWPVLDFLIFSIWCLSSNAIVIAIPPSIKLATPIIAYPLMAPVALTPSATNTNDQTILCFIFIGSDRLI